MAQMRWWVLAFVAAVLLLASAGGFFWIRRAPAPSQPPPVPRARCPDVDREAPAMLPDSQTTPALLWAVGKVRLFIDGEPAFSPPDAPRSFSPGEHTLRAEAEGAEPLELRFRLDPFRPAFFHLESTGAAGLSVAYLGASCVSCPAALDKVTLDFTRVSEPDEALLTAAARALRDGDWRTASARLRGVQPKGRTQALFLRLAANVYQSTAQSQPALAALKKVPAAQANDLDTVLKAFEPLIDSEQVRSQTLGMRRWNLLTEKFSGLLEKFAPEAPGPVQIATSRLAELSAGFLEATTNKDPPAQDDTVRAGEEALSQFVRALRRSRPEDCDFQSRISSSL